MNDWHSMLRLLIFAIAVFITVTVIDADAREKIITEQMLDQVLLASSIGESGNITVSQFIDRLKNVHTRNNSRPRFKEWKKNENIYQLSVEFAGDYYEFFFEKLYRYERAASGFYVIRNGSPVDARQILNEISLLPTLKQSAVAIDEKVVAKKELQKEIAHIKEEDRQRRIALELGRVKNLEDLTELNGLADKANHGDLKAKVDLSNKYLELGLRGLEAKWLLEAAMHGDSEACFRIGNIYWSKDDKELTYFEGKLGRSKPFRQDQVEAIKWHLKSAESGHAKAQFIIGRFHYDTDIYNRDYVAAFRWLKLSAEQGNSAAQRYLSDAYRFGRGVTASQKDAVKWCQQAAEGGDIVCQMFLAQWYLEGHMGLERSVREGVKWLRAAKENDKIDDNIESEAHKFVLRKLAELGL